MCLFKITGALLLAVSCRLYAVEPTTKEEPKKILSYTILPNPVVLGDLVLGTKTTCSFTIINRSDKPLTIKKIRPNCVCVKVKSFPKDAILPNRQAVVKAEIVADAKEGSTRKIFYVHLSDKDNPIAKVFLKVKFIKGQGAKLVVSGNKLEFGEVKVGTKQRLAVLRLMNFGDMPLKITKIVNNNKALTLKLDSDKPVYPHKGVTLRTWLDATKLQAQNFTEDVFIMTDSTLSPAIAIKAVAIIKQD